MSGNPAGSSHCGRPPSNCGSGRLAGRQVLWTWLCLILGAVLLIAAGLKAHQLVTQPMIETGLFGSRWFSVLLVEAELLLGLVLLLGIFQRPAWIACLVFFGAATAVSLHKALVGEASCGCFGTLEVNPWATSILDLTALLLLTLTRFSPTVQNGVPLRRLGLVSVVVMLFAVSVLVVPEQSVVLSADMVLDDDTQLVVLKPTDWIGRPFPLREHVGIGDRLAEGEWLVMFYHSGCPKCEEAVHRVRLQQWREPTRSIALLEVPPLRQAYHDDPRFAGVVLGALDQRRHWLVHTPVALTLREGLVVAVDDRIGERDLDDALSNNTPVHPLHPGADGQTW